MILFGIIAIPVVLIGLLVLAGYSLGTDEHKIASARTWKRKRRELRDSVESKQVWL